MKLTAEPGPRSDAGGDDDEVTLLVELEAPGAPDPDDESGRAGSCLQIVLDRGAAMSGAPLECALEAIAAIAHRLDARDSFGLVTFGDEASVLVPAGPLTDKDEVVDRLAGIEARGPSHLAEGYLRGLAEVRRATDESGGTLLVVSDGHTGPGQHEIAALEELARRAHDDGIVTSTLAHGRGADDLLLASLARAGSGHHHIVQNAPEAGAAIASEVADLLARSVQSVSLTVRLDDGVELLGYDGDVAGARLSDGALTMDLGDLYFEEQRRFTLRLRATTLGTSVPRHLGTVELRYAELPSLLEQHVVHPVVLADPAAEQREPETALTMPSWGL